MQQTQGYIDGIILQKIMNMKDEFKELYNNIENDIVKKIIIHNIQSKFKNADHNKKENDSKPTNNSKLNDKNKELKAPTGCMNTSNKK